MPRAIERKFLKYYDGAYHWENDLVVEERRVEIYVNGRPYLSVMATPAQLDYLAIGYLFSEGVINNCADIKSISIEALNVMVEVEAQAALRDTPARARSSGFGLGSVTLGDIQLENAGKAKAGRPPIKAERLVALMEEFNQLSALFWETGAVHSSCLVNGGHRFFSEDVGRHNTLDKVIGQYLSAGLAPSAQAGLVFTTGRISSEMLIKTAKAGQTALISRGSASGLAIEMAEKLDIILIGFSRGRQFKAFYGGEHIFAPDIGGGPDD